MEWSGDAIAGIVDLFGGLTRTELGEGLAELAFKRREEYDPDAFATEIDDALDAYRLVAVEAAAVDHAVAKPLLVAGPVAFPELPAGATDLPHILGIDERTVEREIAARAATRRFETDADTAIDAGDGERIETLLDVSYELEAWGPVDLETERSRLSDAMD